MAPSLPQTVHDIFVPAIGQYENIGDIILRRQLLRWLRPAGRLHVFVGAAHDGYEQSLELSPQDVSYSSFLAWYRAALARASQGTASYVFKPGEIQLTLLGTKEHLAMAPLAALVRLRGGKVLRVGAGTRNVALIPKWLIAPSVLLANRVWWRDSGTAHYMGRGQVMPDLAFGEGDPTEVALRPAPRDLLTISMRGDRPMLPRAWIEGVRQFAQSQGLTIQIITQVARDAPRSAALAAELGGRLLNWDGAGHAEQEAQLRNVYRRTRAVVSDRLHVLISAYTHGAIPLAPLNDGSDKIARHFDAAGIGGVAFATTSLDSQTISARLQLLADKGPDALARLPAIRVELQQVRDEIVALLARRPAWTDAAREAR